jgi:hypothetical protein
VGVRRDAAGVLMERPDGKSHLEYLGVDGKVIIKWIFKKWNGKAWIGLICLWIETVGGSLRIW